MIACEKVYYYHGNGLLYVSDNFWDIVRGIQPDFSGIDADNVRKRLLLGSSLLNDETIVKGLKIILPATRVVYDIAEDALTSEAYQIYRFTGEVADRRTAAERLDAALDRTMKNIKEKHGDVVYGIGLSGGLDSRVVLHYARKNNMRVSCFNLCKKRPHGILKARSVRLAEEIARMYNVPFTVVEWDPKQVDAAKVLHTMRYPDGGLSAAATDLFKVKPGWKPDFDVLLTGGMGAAMQLFSDHYAKTDGSFTSMVNCIVEEMLFPERHGMANLLNKTMHVLFGAPVHKYDTYHYDWERRLFAQKRPEIRETVERFVERMQRENLGELETYYNFRCYLTMYGCNGGFESMFSSLPGYTIYSSAVLNEGLKWKADLLEGRQVLREVIRLEMPEASQIAEENHQAAPAKIDHFRFIRKVLALADRALRGMGTHVAGRYWNTPLVWHSFVADMESNCHWFNDIVECKIPVDEIKRTNATEMLSIWETKRILDAMEQKKYQSWKG